jgi:hypothetical protein
LTEFENPYKIVPLTTEGFIMDYADAIIAGMIMGEMDEMNYRLAEQNTLLQSKNNDSVQSIKQQLVNQMREEGMLLPKYNWNKKEFANALAAITDEWFKRHPETKRGTGEFQAKYPEKIEAENLLIQMAKKGRITPDEYVVLYREINSF